MTRRLATLAAAVAALALAGPAAASDPLENYERVEPAAALDPPDAAASDYPAGQVERGRYLAAAGNCTTCHTHQGQNWLAQHAPGGNVSGYQLHVCIP